ncbi:MAG: RNA-binding S4 domain-containing protein [Eubacteriales bacterium]
MRLDKYLKVSRLIKRRTVAKDVCEGDKVSLNGRIAKPSVNIKEGDIITIDMKNHILEARVLSTPPNTKANEAHLLYEILKDEKKNDLDI